MSDTNRHDAWKAGDSYDRYMGRWSRKVAPLFLDWLGAADGLDWLEVGCGTGALTAAILARCTPRSIVAIDPSEGFIAQAQVNVEDDRATFAVGDAQDVRVADSSRDVAASGLVLNFVADRGKALAEMARVLRPGGELGFYVWDYPGGGIQFMRAFWQAATALDGGAETLTEVRRFPFCTAEALTDLVRQVGLKRVEFDRLHDSDALREFRRFLGTLHARRRACTRLLPEPRSGSAAAAQGKARCDASAKQRRLHYSGGAGVGHQSDGRLTSSACGRTGRNVHLW